MHSQQKVHGIPDSFEYEKASLQFSIEGRKSHKDEEGHEYQLPNPQPLGNACHDAHPAFRTCATRLCCATIAPMGYSMVRGTSKT